MMSAQQPEGHYASAKLQNSFDFCARFGRNVTEDVANWQFFCRRCQKEVEKLGNIENSFYLSIVRRNGLATVLSAASKALQMPLSSVLPKEVGMCTCIGHQQHQFTVVLVPDEEPVRCNVTFPVALVLSV